MPDTKKVAMVTGAGSGIGKAAVLALAGDGYACVLAGRRKEPIEAVAAEIAGSGGEAIAVPTDVGDPGLGRCALCQDEEGVSAAST